MSFRYLSYLLTKLAYSQKPDSLLLKMLTSWCQCGIRGTRFTLSANQSLSTWSQWLWILLWLWLILKLGSFCLGKPKSFYISSMLNLLYFLMLLVQFSFSMALNKIFRISVCSCTLYYTMVSLLFMAILLHLPYLPYYRLIDYSPLQLEVAL